MGGLGQDLVVHGWAGLGQCLIAHGLTFLGPARPIRSSVAQQLLLIRILIIAHSNLLIAQINASQ